MIFLYDLTAPSPPSVTGELENPDMGLGAFTRWQVAIMVAIMKNRCSSDWGCPMNAMNTGNFDPETHYPSLGVGVCLVKRHTWALGSITGLGQEGKYHPR
jgi:hypothetical protein